MSYLLSGKPFENELKKIVDIFNNKKNGPLGYCNVLIKHLDDIGKNIAILRDSYGKNTNILHLLASDVKKGIEDKTNLFTRPTVCGLFFCNEINDIFLAIT
jgi:hypothetical protein